MAYQMLRWLHQKVVGLMQELEGVITHEIVIGS